MKSNKKSKRVKGHEKQPSQAQTESPHVDRKIQASDEQKGVVNPASLVKAFRYPPPPKYKDISFDPAVSTQQKTTFDEILGSWKGDEVDTEHEDPEESESDFNQVKVRGRYKNEIENIYGLFQVTPQVEKVHHISFIVKILCLSFVLLIFIYVMF